VWTAPQLAAQLVVHLVDLMVETLELMALRLVEHWVEMSDRHEVVSKVAQKVDLLGNGIV
jgi:hypothetical protein